MAHFTAHADRGPGDRSGYLARGDVLDGKYRVERTLAEGGVGIVVLATQLQLDRPVAIKYLRREVLQHRSLVEQFEREARLAAKIGSEHVVRVHDVGVNAAIGPYLVMEFLEGEDLEAVLERGPLPVEPAVRYVLQACEALAEAHELAIVHRDLKPANLFLARASRTRPILKVIDFGIARHASRRGEWSSEEATAGTPAYMAPEQLEEGRSDARSDIWALGVVLYELLTRSLPFQAPTLEQLCDRVLSAPPPSLCALRVDVPPSLEAIVSRCLEKDPARRFQTAAELAEALAPMTTPEPVTSPGFRRPVDPRTKNPTVVIGRKASPPIAVLVGAAALAALLIAGLGLVLMNGAAREPSAVAPTASASPATTAMPETATTATAELRTPEPAPTLAAPPAPLSTDEAPPATAAPKPAAAGPTPLPRTSAPKSDRSGMFGAGRQ